MLTAHTATADGDPPSRRAVFGRSRGTAWLIALPMLVALITVATSLLVGDYSEWQHLWHYVLPDVLFNTVTLAAGVMAVTAVLGTGLAWLTATCDFPGRRWLDWSLLLPLAIPGYVFAFVYIGLLDYAGPLRSVLRDSALGDGWFPEIRSRGGVILTLSLALYPYVYLLARNAFLTQGRRMLEVSQSLGMNIRHGFVRGALPLARPWILTGVMLVGMDTLADFGTVATFNYDTFTTAIYKSWFGLFSIDAALQLSAVLIMLVAVGVSFEQRSRRGSRFTALGGGAVRRYRLRGARAASASLFASTVFAIGFLIPLLQLLVWAGASLDTELDSRYLGLLLRSLLLASAGALLVTGIALLLTFVTRRAPDLLTRAATRIATLGYAMPGAVLAVSIFVPVAALSRLLTELTQAAGFDYRFLLQNSLLVLLLAYLVRFLTVAHGPVASAMLRVTPSIEDAARSLGSSGNTLLRKIYLPMLQGGVATGSVLVFVELMKEMPITLMTRPFGWDTLAVRIFELTSEGEWERAALPAISILLVGLVPVALLVKHAGRDK